MKNILKISITTLGAITILGTSVMALTGNVNSSSGLVLRKAADRNSEPITTVPAQTEVNIIEKSGDWYKVTYNSQEGYLYAEYVKTTETPQETEQPTEAPTQAEPNNQVSNKVKVYNIPLITSTVINEIPENTQITIQKQITNWSYVSAGDIQGWVRTYAINENANAVSQETKQPEVEPETKQPEVEPETNQPEVEPETQQPENEETKPEETTPVAAEPETNAQEETPTSVKIGAVNVNYANVRKEASTSSDILTTLAKDTSFTIEEETAEWYKIKYTATDGTVYNGYISKSLVTVR